MGGQILKDILIGRTSTGNAAPGAVQGTGRLSSNSPSYMRLRDEPSLPFVSSYLETIPNGDTEEPSSQEPVLPIPSGKSRHSETKNLPSPIDKIRIDGIRIPKVRSERPAPGVRTPRVRGGKIRTTSGLGSVVEVEITPETYTKEESKAGSSSPRVPVSKESASVPDISKSDTRLSEVSNPKFHSVLSPNRGRIDYSYVRAPDGHGSVKTFSYSVGDIEIAPEGTPRTVAFQYQDIGEYNPNYPRPQTPADFKPLACIETGFASRVFDLDKPEDITAFMDYWKRHPLDSKVTVQSFGDGRHNSDRSGALGTIPSGLVRMYAFWLNPVKEYSGVSYDFSTQEGRDAWKSLVTKYESLREPDSWYEPEGFPPRRDPNHTPVSWDVLKGTRLEGAIPLSYQIYKMVNTGLDQVREYEKQKAAYEAAVKAAEEGQQVVRYTYPKSPVNRFFNVQGEALKTIAAGSKDFSQNYTPATLQRMGERVAVGDMSPLARAIYLVIQSNKNLSRSDLADAFGVTETDVDQAMVLVNKFVQGLATRSGART